MSDSRYVDTGLSMGSALACIISWGANDSILWAILHGILSWFYVLYFAVETGRFF